MDALDRRVAKKKNGVIQKSWLYLDALRVAAELDGAGNVQGRYVYGTRSNVPELAFRADGNRLRIVSDHLGTPKAVALGETGELLQELEHDAWGNELKNTAPGALPFGFAGGLYDPDTRLVHFGKREYDPETGRWTSKDPIRFSGGQSNLYVYAGDDPVNRRDPHGMNGIGDLLDGAGALIDFGREWWYGVRQDGVNDKFYHCMANCTAASRGPGGSWVANMLSNLREGLQSQPTSTSADEDQEANHFGRDAGAALCRRGGGPDPDNTSCVESCVDRFGFEGDGRSNPREVGSGGSGQYN